MWLEAGRNFTILVVAATLFYLLSQTTKELEILFSLLGGLTLIAAISMLISTAFERRMKVPTFEPYPVVIVAARDGVARLTSLERVEVHWSAVTAVAVDEYSLSIGFADSAWWIPRSAFATKEEMAEEGQRMEHMRAAAVIRSPESTAESETASKTLH
jgi:hypothetical protein